MRNLMDKLQFRSLGLYAGLLSLVAFAGIEGSADANLTTAVDSVTTYFTANIGLVIGAVVSIAVFMWLLRIAFRSFGIRKPRSVE